MPITKVYIKGEKMLDSSTFHSFFKHLNTLIIANRFHYGNEQMAYYIITTIFIRVQSNEWSSILK